MLRGSQGGGGGGGADRRFDCKKKWSKSPNYGYLAISVARAECADIDMHRHKKRKTQTPLRNTPQIAQCMLGTGDVKDELTISLPSGL